MGDRSSSHGDEPEAPGPLPFPSSLCHSCGAPPRYVSNGRSTFILCPILPNKYPPQPVRRCHAFRPRPPAKEPEATPLPE